MGAVPFWAPAYMIPRLEVHDWSRPNYGRSVCLSCGFVLTGQSLYTVPPLCLVKERDDPQCDVS